MKLWTLVFSCLVVLKTVGAIPDYTVGSSFQAEPVSEGWIVLGETNLFRFRESEGDVQVTWDSSKANSFLALPLGLTLTKADDFTVTFEFRLEDIAIGTTPDKPYTFQIATGLINLTNVVASNFFRGSGINSVTGPRNILEWTYFPDSGFGATVGPTVISQSNQIVYSDNHPLEIEPGVLYQVELAYSADQRMLFTTMWADGAPFGLPPSNELQPISLPSTFMDFGVNAFAISSYSDAGQNPPQFSGSVLAHGFIDNVHITIRNRPRLALEKSPNGVKIRFPSETGWEYWLEASEDTVDWTIDSGPLTGSGNAIEMIPTQVGTFQIFRVRGVKMIAQ